MQKLKKEQPQNPQKPWMPFCNFPLNHLGPWSECHSTAALAPKKSDMLHTHQRHTRDAANRQCRPRLKKTRLVPLLAVYRKAIVRFLCLW